MARYRLLIEYDGRPFCGWQRQTNALSVQEVLELAVYRFCGEVTEVAGAGRTDAGVHSTGMVAHVDIQKPTDARTVMMAMNAHIRPEPVSVLSAYKVSDSFHARFSAIERQYTYTLINRAAPLTFQKGLAWHIPYKLDAQAMAAGAKILEGHHDFTSFRSTSCQAKSAKKTLNALRVEQKNNRIDIHVHARSFLHNQVRIMTGGLVTVGRGKWTPDDIKAVLEAKDRSAGPMTAPPDGLTLTGVTYPIEFDC